MTDTTLPQTASSTSGERPGGELAALLKSSQPGFWRRALPWLALLAALLLALTWRATSVRQEKTTTYLTHNLAAGDLSALVTATGSLEPTHQVTVGSELSGLVAEVLVAENDVVAQGQVLVRLDTVKLEEQIQRTRAARDTARAQVSQAEATVREMASNLRRLEQLSLRSEGSLVAVADLDTARAQSERAEASLASARAGLAEAESALRVNQQELVKATIRSPIDGIVLSRNIEPGQTVAASLQAPVLFTLAEDLRAMRLEVGVAEADVAKVAAGQLATFTVDAWPGESFTARVEKVQYGSKVIENVVTYATELQVDNNDLRLRPGMTATAELQVAERRGVLLVPNAALRFSPPTQVVAKKTSFSLLPRPPGVDKAATPATAGDRVFVLKDGQPVEVAVEAGLTDGKSTEISGEGLSVGDLILLEIEEGVS